MKYYLNVEGKESIKPRCALLIPHYNNVEGLSHSLASISPDEHLDIFVVDDGSVYPLDEAKLSANFQAQGKLYFIYLSKNQGIQYALNRGLEEISGEYEYIARLDCGDLCATNRFSRQMTFLDTHPEIGLVGSAVIFNNANGKPLYTLTLPGDDQAIRRAMHINCAFIHPSVMWRVSVGKELGFYPTDYPMAEDFAYFWRFLKATQVANLQEVLVWVQMNVEGLSISRRKTQLYSRLRLQKQYFDWGILSSYYGILKTLLLMLLPYRWVLAYKKMRGRK